MNNLIINPQFILSQQTHSKRRLHRIELQEDRGDHCIENQRERKSHLATSYGPVSLWWTTHTSFDVEASVIDSPSGTVPKNASRWDHGRMEACDGGKTVSGSSFRFSQY